MREYTKISLHNHLGGKGSDKKIDDEVNDPIIIDYKEALNKIDKLYKAGFKLIAITNSNNINVELMYLMQYYCFKKKYNMKILPGAELNLFNDNKILHICMILDSDNPNIYLAQNDYEAALIENKKNYILYEQLLSILVNDNYKIKTMLSPHGIKQNERSLGSNSEHVVELKQMDSQLIPILIEDNQKFNRYTLLAKLKSELNEENYNWLELATDVSAVDRDNYNIDPTLVWCKNNFNDLYYSAIMKETRFFRESDLQEKVDYISKIRVKIDDGETNEIELSHGLNTIVGDSGSGKTLLLNWMYKELSGDNISCTASSITNTYDNVYSAGEIKLFNKENKELSKDDIKVFHGDNLYNKIVSMLSKDRADIVSILGGEIDSLNFVREISQVNKFIDKLVKNNIQQKKLENEFIEKYKAILETSSELKKINRDSSNISSLNQANIEDEIERIQKSIEEITKVAEEVKQLLGRLNEIIKKFKIPLVEIVSFLQDRILKALRVIYISRKKDDITLNIELIKLNILNENIDYYNKRIGRNSVRFNEMKKQVETDIILSSNAILNLYKSSKEKVALIDSYTPPNLESLKLKPNSELKLNYLQKKNIIEIDDFSEVIKEGYSIKSKKKEATLTQVLLKEKGLEKLDIFDKNQINDFCSLLVDENYGNFDENYIKLEISDKYEDYLKIMVQVMNIDSNDFVDINTLSAGQLGKYYIEKMLTKEIVEKAPNKKLIVFFDQPDNSIGKKFILESLVLKLRELKMDYQVIITTHEPLLVINADANCIIQAKNEKTVSQGNKFSFNRIDISSNINSAEDVIKKISEIIDGSHDAVKHRNNIYEGMRYGN